MEIPVKIRAGSAPTVSGWSPPSFPVNLCVLGGSSTMRKLIKPLCQFNCSSSSTSNESAASEQLLPRVRRGPCERKEGDVVWTPLCFPKTGKKKSENRWQLGVSGDKPRLHQPQHCSSMLGFEIGGQEEIKMRRRPHMIFKCHKEQMEGFNFPIFARWVLEEKMHLKRFPYICFLLGHRMCSPFPLISTSLPVSLQPGQLMCVKIKFQSHSGGSPSPKLLKPSTMKEFWKCVWWWV